MSNSEATTLADTTEHIRVVRSGSVSDAIDPRIMPEERASQEQLDESHLRQASDRVHRHERPKHPEKTSIETVSEDNDDNEGPLYV